eukprot:EG_transcript_26050
MEHGRPGGGRAAPASPGASVEGDVGVRLELAVDQSAGEEQRRGDGEEQQPRPEAAKPTGPQAGCRRWLGEGGGRRRGREDECLPRPLVVPHLLQPPHRVARDRHLSL